MNGESCIILLIISKRLNDLFSLASCQCCSGIQCYKTSGHSRRAGGEKLLVSLWLELLSSGQAGLQVNLELILLFGLSSSEFTSMLGGVHTVAPLNMRIPTTKTELE